MAEYVLGNKLLEAHGAITREGQSDRTLNAFCNAFLECLNFACEGQLFRGSGHYIEAETHEGLILSLTTIPEQLGTEETSIFNVVNIKRIADNQPSVSGTMIIKSVRTNGEIQTQSIAGHINDGTKLKSSEDFFTKATQLAIFSYGKKLGLTDLDK